VRANPFQPPSEGDIVRDAPSRERGQQLLVAVVAINLLYSLAVIWMTATVTGQITPSQIIRTLIEVVLYVQLLRRRAMARDAIVLLWVLGGLFALARGSWSNVWTAVHLAVVVLTVGVLTWSRAVRAWLVDPGPQ
jgi:hypothetical protein